MSMSMSSSTPATVRVEKATSDLLMGPDWTLNMDICDSVNSDHWQAKDVIKAVKKRLQHRNPKVQFLALTLLETMIKNCGDYVHFQVVEREILQEMVKIVRKKTDMQVRDKILVLLDSWQEAFGGAGGKYPQYYWAYADLKRSGVQFPERSPDSTLIFTPPALTSPGTRRPQVGYGMPSNSAVRLDEAMASEMANLSLSDVDSMHSVMELLSEMLKAVNPNDRSAIEDEVIIDLVSQCRSNQKKLMQSINSIRDEELLGRGLELNDNIQSLLAKHDAIASGSPVPVEASESNPKAPIVAQPKAVEVSETVPSPSTPIAPQPATTNRYDDEKEDEDDDFAQLARRNSIFNPNSADSKSVATSNHLRSPNQSVTPSTVAGSMDGASSTQASNALTLPDPPNPVKTASKEQDIIDLLSITLSSNPSPPRTPVTPPNISDHSASPPPIPSAQHFNPQSPMPYDVNQTYIPQNNYVTPWAQAQTHSSSPLQSQTQSEVPLNSSGYPPPPWAIALANTSANSSAAAAYQHSVPDFGGGGLTYSTQASRPMQRFYSFGSGVSNVSTIITEARSNPNLGQTGPSTARPYVYTNRLFNELADFRTSNPDPKNKPAPSLSGTSGPGMISGRK